MVGVADVVIVHLLPHRLGPGQEDECGPGSNSATLKVDWGGRPLYQKENFSSCLMLFTGEATSLWRRKCRTYLGFLQAPLPKWRSLANRNFILNFELKQNHKNLNYGDMSLGEREGQGGQYYFAS